jgi:hypothetical protein
MVSRLLLQYFEPSLVVAVERERFMVGFGMSSNPQ